MNPRELNLRHDGYIWVPTQRRYMSTRTLRRPANAQLYCLELDNEVLALGHSEHRCGIYFKKVSDQGL